MSNYQASDLGEVPYNNSLDGKNNFIG